MQFWMLLNFFRTSLGPLARHFSSASFLFSSFICSNYAYLFCCTCDFTHFSLALLFHCSLCSFLLAGIAYSRNFSRFPRKFWFLSVTTIVLTSFDFFAFRFFLFPIQHSKLNCRRTSCATQTTQSDTKLNKWPSNPLLPLLWWWSSSSPSTLFVSQQWKRLKWKK